VTGTGIPWFCEWICPSGTLLAGLPLITLNPEFREAIGFQFYWKLGVLLLIVFASIAYYRPFCKYICPLGAIYGVFNPISTYRLVVDKEKCVSCGACQKACGMDIKTNETPNSPDCIRCLKCVSACPTGALDSSWNIARKKFEARLVPNEEVRENRFVVQTILTALLGFLGSVSVLIVTFKYMVFDAFSFYLDDVYPLSALVALSLFSIVIGIIGFFLLIKSIDLFKNRNDANAIHRFKEGTSMMWRVWLISLLVYVVVMIFHPSLLMAGINLAYLNPFPFLGLPLLNAQVSLLEKCEENKFARIVWWIVFILLVAVTGFSVFNGAQILVAKLD
jgi:ferredoxin